MKKFVSVLLVLLLLLSAVACGEKKPEPEPTVEEEIVKIDEATKALKNFDVDRSAETKSGNSVSFTQILRTSLRDDNGKISLAVTKSDTYAGATFACVMIDKTLYFAVNGDFSSERAPKYKITLTDKEQETLIAEVRSMSYLSPAMFDNITKTAKDHVLNYDASTMREDFAKALTPEYTKVLSANGNFSCTENYVLKHLKAVLSGTMEIETKGIQPAETTFYLAVTPDATAPLTPPAGGDAFDGDTLFEAFLIYLRR